MSEKGKLVVISGPSGAGKSTIVFKAIEGRMDFCFSTSVTTRAPRPGEVDGREYFFIDRERYDQMVANGEKLAEGMNVVLDIEVQGARQVHESVPGAVMIFIIPPSMEELRRRLINRGTDSMEAIEGRLQRARQEYAEAEIYDYLIVNEDADVAASEFSAIIKAEHLRTRDRLYLLK